MSIIRSLEACVQIEDFTVKRELSYLVTLFIYIILHSTILFVTFNLHLPINKEYWHIHFSMICILFSMRQEKMKRMFF